jgi:hypothetical protein
MPVQVSEQEWQGAFLVSGLADLRVRRGHGADGVQALQQALEGIRVLIRDSGIPMTWLGGNVPGAGFPRSIPLFFGPEFVARVEGLIDDEIEAFAAKAKESRGR